MPALWLVPAAITALGAVVLWAAITRLSSEAVRLSRAVQGWNRLRPALIEVGNEAEALRARLEQLRSGR